MYWINRHGRECLKDPTFPNFLQYLVIVGYEDYESVKAFKRNAGLLPWIQMEYWRFSILYCNVCNCTITWHSLNLNIISFLNIDKGSIKGIL